MTPLNNPGKLSSSKYGELSKKDLRRRKRYLDERLHMLYRRTKLIEEELIKIESLESYYRVCIFGSARIRPESQAYLQVTELAESLAGHGIDILTGGGPGLMEAANLGAKRGFEKIAKKGKSFGLSIELPFEPRPNRHLDIKRHHHKFSSRLDDFMRLSHSIIVTPGGIGTLLELFFSWQLIQVNHAQSRPIVLLGRDFWQDIYNWLREVPFAKGLISESDFAPIQLTDSVAEAAKVVLDHFNAKKKEEDFKLT
jgi:uncharacterized protein (TIGR00730 family)